MSSTRLVSPIFRDSEESGVADENCNAGCAGGMLKTAMEEIAQQPLLTNWPATTASRQPGAAICRLKTARRQPIR